MIDLACSLTVVVIALIATSAYAVRAAVAGSAHDARVDQDGGSALLGRGPMEMAYWALGPVANACVSLGISANAVTALSLGLGAAAGVALRSGHFGVAAALTAACSLGDAVDGMVARATATSSDAGEVLDAAADRYVEFFFLGGLAVLFRADPLGLALSLLAIFGSFMVSYGTAKAEALHVPAPRGSMRRAERAVYLTLGVVLVPLVEVVQVRLGLPQWAPRAPVIAALTLVGVVSNVSAVRRLYLVALSVRARDAERAPAPGSAEPSSPVARPGAGSAVGALSSTESPVRALASSGEPRTTPR